MPPKKRKQTSRKKPKPKKKPFTVFEAGTGKRPLGLLHQAVKASNARKAHRRFMGVEDQGFNVSKALTRLFGRKGIPKNLKLVSDCAVHVITKPPSESQNIIFESYLLNNISRPSKCFGISTCEEVFLTEAKRVLKPGGRLVLVQGKPSVDYYREIAEELGFGFHVIEIPAEKAQRSFSRSIRMRSLPEKRLRVLRHPNIGTDFADDAVKAGKAKSREDATRPVIILMRKPRKGEKPIIVRPVRDFNDLSATERSIVDGIMADRR
ncbi:MAG: hypothetical protein JW772_04665 [Candidatus Diapherotrites archaeon]|nr:hypothetical protein [Candidatus Diapherotrites archaeon]